LMVPTPSRQDRQVAGMAASASAVPLVRPRRLYLVPPWMMPCEWTVCPPPRSSFSISAAEYPSSTSRLSSHNPAMPPPTTSTSRSAVIFRYVVMCRNAPELSPFCKRRFWISGKDVPDRPGKICDNGHFAAAGGTAVMASHQNGKEPARGARGNVGWPVTHHPADF